MLSSLNSKCYNKRSQGYVLLLSVILLSAIGGAIVISVILMGLGSLRTTFAGEQAVQAKSLATACAEEALQQIRSNYTFTGTGNLTLSEGTCSYTVTNQGGQNRIVTSTGTCSTITRKLKIIISAVTPSIKVVSWQELADF